MIKANVMSSMSAPINSGIKWIVRLTGKSPWHDNAAQVFWNVTVTMIEELLTPYQSLSILILTETGSFSH